MTNLAQITQRAAHDNVPAITVEKDYVMSHIIAALGSINDHSLVFKGGTALRLCYFHNFRYSADLDFSLVAGNIEEAYETIGSTLVKVVGSIEAIQLTDSEPRSISYRGPLGRSRTLKLDITADELVFNVNTVSLVERWPDVPNGVPVRVYPLSEIAGEKLRCVMQRVQCRDLLDLWFLFENTEVDSEEAAHVFLQKAKHRGLNSERFKTIYEDRLQQYRDRWTNELESFVLGDVPQFNQVERMVSRYLRVGNLL